MGKIKLAIGSNIFDGPWGGGNQFAVCLTKYLKNKSWSVVNDLKDNDIDIILLTEPRKNLQSCRFNQLDIAGYVLKKPNTIVVHRINECDERKGTKNVNNYLKRANQVADFTVFISTFLKKIFIDGGILDTKDYLVIKNGADRGIFNREGIIKWNKVESLKIVTHHWGGNIYKGFDIYSLIDNILEIGLNQINKDSYIKCCKALVKNLSVTNNIYKINKYKINKENIYHLNKDDNKDNQKLEGNFNELIKLKKLISNMEFCYIGNIPAGFEFKKTKVINPLKGIQLANEIKRNHIYLTASINEPAGMHHIEGALCGLPLLYRKSGGIPEYAYGFGVSFIGINDFFSSLIKLIENYDYYFNIMDNYPNDSETMCKNYEELFLKLLSNRNLLNLEERKKKYRTIYFKEKFLYKRYAGDG